MSKFFFLLGADDPEMRKIARVLMVNGYEFGYALAKNGERVTPGEAYYCQSPVPYAGEKIVCVECQPQGYSTGDFIRVDHHRPGDPGYTLGPAHYWEASSIGQVCELMRIQPSRELRVIAAMDHCFARAIRGECPDVLAGHVRDHYVRDIAKNRRLRYVDVDSEVIQRMTRISEERTMRIGSQDVGDCRAWELGGGYSLEYLASIAAASISGRAILLSTADSAGRKKVVLCGYVRPETVAAFKEIAPVDFHLFDVYGVPVRGYAGGYSS